MPPAPEDQQLDAALLETTPRLAASLQRDEITRWRRRAIGFAVLAGITTIIAVVSTALLLSQGTSSNVNISNAEQAADFCGEGWRLWQARDYASAEFKFQHAVDLDPQLSNAWNGLGWSRFNAGKANAAREAFQKCLAIDPDYAAALNGMGQLELAQDHRDEAEKWLLKAAPNAPAAWWGLARLYLLEKRYDDATQWLQRILQSDPGNVEATEMLRQAKQGNQ